MGEIKLIIKANQKRIDRIRKYLKDCKGWRTKSEMIFTLGGSEELFNFALKYCWIRVRDRNSFRKNYKD